MIVRIVVTACMALLWAVFMVEGLKKPSPGSRWAVWIGATVVTVVIVFRTWGCPGFAAACWP